jgi:hypothetical protein
VDTVADDEIRRVLRDANGALVDPAYGYRYIAKA